jgi:hypothetical protein
MTTEGSNYATMGGAGSESRPSADLGGEMLATPPLCERCQGTRVVYWAPAHSAPCPVCALPRVSWFDSRTHEPDCECPGCIEDSEGGM